MYTAHLAVNVTPEAKQWLEKYAADHGVSLSVAVRWAVADMQKREEDRASR